MIRMAAKRGGAQGGHVMLSGDLLRLRPVRLDAAPPPAPGAATPPARWVQVAYSGKFRGHANGEFEFTAETFAKLIQNFRAHPSYRAGAPMADPAMIEAGSYDVVHWDFSHASEQNPTEGELPVVGAPATGWVLELDARPGPGGETQLWAYTRFLEPLRSYVREGRYKWASVTVYFNAVDPVSGAEIGPYMSSIAATNDPFLQGMVPLVAKRGGAVRAEHYYDPYNPPSTPEELLCELRELFELSPTAELGEVLAELAKLKAWATGGAAPPIGVEVGELVGQLRRLFNLPTLATADEVFAAADGLLSALAESSAAKAASGGAAPPATAPAAAASRRSDLHRLTLGGILGIR